MLPVLQTQPLLTYGTLAATGLLHEDIAILAGAVLIVEHGAPVWPVLACLVLSATVGDLCIYSLGFGAHRLPWCRRLVRSPRVQAMGSVLHRHLGKAVLGCRLLPGVTFPTFAACGWFRVPLRRFLTLTTLGVLIYTPLVLGLTVLFRVTVLRALGWAGWVLLAALLAAALAGLRRSQWSAFRHLLDLSPRALVAAVAVNGVARITHRGMPPLGRLRRWVAVSERIPPFLFYAPLFFRWLWVGLRYGSLSLPALANPRIEGGGLWGESKSACLDLMAEPARQWVAPYVVLHRGPAEAAVRDADAAVELIRERRIGLPVVLKPDIGWQGYGVQLAEDEEAVRTYVRRYPPGARLIVQAYLPFDGEAGIFYVRHPGERDGRILSMTLRYYPYVVGDGVTTLGRLISRNPRTRWKARLYLGGSRWHAGVNRSRRNRVPQAGEVVRLSFVGSIRVGGLYRDATSCVTPALEERFQAIATSIPEFHFGRFDIRFQSLEALQSGEGFGIIEVNGAGAEAIHAWDPEKRLSEMYRILLDVQRELFRVAIANRRRGFRPPGVRHLLRLALRQHRLITRYPPSD